MTISLALERILNQTKNGSLKWRADKAGFCETFLKNGVRLTLESGVRFFHYRDGYDVNLYADNGSACRHFHTFEEFKPAPCWVSRGLTLLRAWLCPLLRKILFIRTDVGFRLIKEERKEIDRLLREIAKEVAKVAEVTIGYDKRIGMYEIDDELLRQTTSLIFDVDSGCKNPEPSMEARYSGVMFKPWIHSQYQFEFDPSLLDTLVVLTGVEMDDSYLIPGIYNNSGLIFNSCDDEDLFNNETLLRRGDVVSVSDYLLRTTLDFSLSSVTVFNGEEAIDSLPDDFHNEEYPNARSEE